MTSRNVLGMVSRCGTAYHSQHIPAHSQSFFVPITFCTSDVARLAQHQDTYMYSLCWCRQVCALTMLVQMHYYRKMKRSVTVRTSVEEGGMHTEACANQ